MIFLFSTRTGLADAPTVLFLHGFLGSHEDWQPITASLSDTFQCIAVDLPGHGQSIRLNDESYTFERATMLIAEASKQYENGTCHVVGYSLGGRLALYLAVQHPEIVKSVTILSASPGLAAEQERIERQHDDAAIARRLETENKETFLRDWYAQSLFASLAKNTTLLETTITMRHKHDAKEWAKALRGLGVGNQPSLWEKLSTISIPTLLLTGETDSKFIAIANKMKTMNTTFKTETIAQAGHALHIEQPVIVADHIRSFIREIEKGY